MAAAPNSRYVSAMAQETLDPGALVGEYDDHIASTPVGDGRFELDLSEGWSVGGGLNGGYLLGVIAHAARQRVSGKPDPIAVSAHYVSATRPGSAVVSTDVRREGGTVATVAADLRQGDATRIAALATFADLDRLGDDVATTAQEFDLPPVEECVATSEAAPELRTTSAMSARFEMRLHPDQAGFATGAPSGKGELSAWFRFRDGREPDALSLVTVVDLLPPVTFDLGKPGWAPTLELSVHVRARPAPGWLKVRHLTRNVAGGLFEEDCEVWDSAGRLVAQSRQLAMEPRPAR